MPAACTAILHAVTETAKTLGYLLLRENDRAKCVAPEIDLRIWLPHLRPPSIHNGESGASQKDRLCKESLTAWFENSTARLT